MFLADLPDPAIRIERTLDTIDSSFTGGHAVMFDDLRVPADAVLARSARVSATPRCGSPRRGSRHCMRWLGCGRARAGHRHRLCRARARRSARRWRARRRRFMLADNMMDIHLARLSILHTAWLLDRASAASNESSMSKVICLRGAVRVADRSCRSGRHRHDARHRGRAHLPRYRAPFASTTARPEVHRWALGARIVSGKM